MAQQVIALAGGVGGSKLALGLARLLPPGQLTIIVNTADDEVFYGLHVSPDLDTVMYTLAGIVNPQTGWGIADDTFNVLAMLERYGAPAWFRLGDRDIATHIRRTQLLGQGRPLSEVTRELCSSLGIAHEVVPMTDDTVRTVLSTDKGDLPFQVYFVQQGCQPRVRGLRFEGAERARPSPRFEAALGEAAAVVFCPSNPFLSIDPILALPGVRERLASFRGQRVAVSPIVGGEAVRGPAAKMMTELGEEASCVGVARRYQALCDVLVIDEVDRDRADEVRALGLKVEVTGTVMATEDDKVTLARKVLSLIGD